MRISLYTSFKIQISQSDKSHKLGTQLKTFFKLAKPTGQTGEGSVLDCWNILRMSLGARLGSCQAEICKLAKSCEYINLTGGKCAGGCCKVRSIRNLIGREKDI